MKLKLIDKDAVLAEIEKLVDKGKYHEEFDCAYRDGNNGALYALKGKVNSLEVKEVDLDDKIYDYINAHYSEGCDGGMISDAHNDIGGVMYSDLTSLAEHFFKLGMRVNNPITAADQGIVEEIIISLKQVENDYYIDQTKEIEWVRNKVKEEEV